jgi:maleylpyruvate isomerase
MKLYSFFRSGTSHRLRIALHLKGLAYEYEAVDLRREEHLGAAYKAIHPQGLVPALQTDGDDGLLIQSPAILEWLEERYPQPPLLPADPTGRARVRALAAIVGCDIHPVNNRRILEALRHDFNADEAAVNRWCATWITAGFDAIEALLAADTRRRDFCFGTAPTLADVYLVPQVESARRFKIDMGRWPLISAVDTACQGLVAFREAAPAVQPDAG